MISKEMGGVLCKQAYSLEEGWLRHTSMHESQLRL